MPKQKLKLLFAAWEYGPLAKVGGLADVAASLPLQLRRKFDIDARIVIPGHKTAIAKAKDTNPVGDSFRAKVRNREVSIILTEAEGTDIPVYLVDAPEFFNRDGIYGQRNGTDYEDSFERSFTFCEGALRLPIVIDRKSTRLNSSHYS